MWGHSRLSIRLLVWAQVICQGEEMEPQVGLRTHHGVCVSLCLCSPTPANPTGSPCAHAKNDPGHKGPGGEGCVGRSGCPHHREKAREARGQEPSKGRGRAGSTPASPTAQEQTQTCHTTRGVF